MGKRQEFLNALATLGDGRYTYESVGGCSKYVRMALGLSGIITNTEANNQYLLWALQCYRSLLKDTTRFQELPASTIPIASDILWYHGAHVAVCAGGNDIYEAAPEGSHGICSNGKTGVGLWKNHTYNCAGKSLTCIYRIIEEDTVKETDKMIKSKDLVNVAIDVCMGKYGNTVYSNSYPYNVGYWNGSTWSFDCLGFVHTMVNGFSGLKQLGGGAVMDSFVNCCDEAATLKSCTTYSTFNGTSLKKGELLQSSGHVGIYIGDYSVTRSDGSVDVYNCAECTLIWSNGCQLSYVDISNGYRYNKKGGQYRSTWNYHGQLSRVDYTEEIQSVIMPEPTESADIATLTPVQKLMTAIEIINGGWGNNPARKEKLTSLYGDSVAVQIQSLVNQAFD